MWLESKLGCFSVLSIPSKSILLCVLKILGKLLKSTVNYRVHMHICECNLYFICVNIIYFLPFFSILDCTLSYDLMGINILWPSVYTLVSVFLFSVKMVNLWVHQTSCVVSRSWVVSRLLSKFMEGFMVVLTLSPAEILLNCCFRALHGNLDEVGNYRNHRSMKSSRAAVVFHTHRWEGGNLSSESNLDDEADRQWASKSK